MAGKRSVGRDLSRLEVAIDSSQRHTRRTPGAYWDALKEYVDPDGDRTAEPDPTEYIPDADSEQAAKRVLGRGSRYGFAARYVAVKVDHGPDDALDGDTETGGVSPNCDETGGDAGR